MEIMKNEQYSDFITETYKKNNVGIFITELIYGIDSIAEQKRSEQNKMSELKTEQQKLSKLEHSRKKMKQMTDR